MKMDEVEQSAKKVLLDLLNGVSMISNPKVVLEPGTAGVDQPDFSVEVKVRDEPWTLLVEVNTFGQPRLVRQAVKQLEKYRDMFPRIYPIFMAPFVSEQSAVILRDNRIGFVDLAGNCNLDFAGIYVQVVGKPNPNTRKDQLKTVFSTKASRVVRVLLHGPDKEWNLSDLAQEVDVSIGLVHNVKKLLLDYEWLRKESDLLSLSNPEALLKAWVDSYKAGKNTRHDYHSLQKIPELEGRLADVCNRMGIKHALTSFSGAERLAPYARYQRVTSFVEKDVSQVADALDLKSVKTGANVSLVLPYDEGVFYGSKEVRGASVASPVQVYLDLKAEKARGDEAAEFLFKEVIQRKWNQ